MEKDCTQDMLAKLIGVQKPQISDLENGKRLPSITELMAYSARFKAPMEYLLGIEGFDNRDYENRKIGTELGLSDEAIIYLNHTKAIQPHLLKMINYMLSTEEGVEFIETMYKLKYLEPICCEKSGKLSTEYEIHFTDGSKENIDITDYKYMLMTKANNCINEIMNKETLLNLEKLEHIDIHDAFNNIDVTDEDD
jgi:transcriptional regulator with XRE-family HTH domain